MKYSLRDMRKELDTLNDIPHYQRTERDKDRMHELYTVMDDIRRPELMKSGRVMATSDLDEFVLSLVEEYYAETSRPVNAFIVCRKYESKRTDTISHQKISPSIARLVEAGYLERLDRSGTSGRRIRVQYYLADLPKSVKDSFKTNRSQNARDNMEWLEGKPIKQPHGNTGRSRRT